MDKINKILILDEGVPFGSKYGFFYTDHNATCLDWEDSVTYIEQLTKDCKDTTELINNLNIEYANLEELEHPSNYSYKARFDLTRMIYKVQENANSKYGKQLDELKIGNLNSMYQYDIHDKNCENENYYKNYKNIRDYVLQKCKKNKIDYETNEEVIMQNILNEFNKYDDKKKTSDDNRSIFDHYANVDINDCYSEEKIEKDFNEYKEKGLKQLKKVNYYGKQEKISNYTFNHFNLNYKLIRALSDKKLFNRKQILKDWAEFLIVLPKVCSIMNTLGNCNEKIHEIEKNNMINGFTEDSKFMSDLEKLLKHKEDEEYYFHATNSGYVESILNKGLFLGSPYLDSTAIPNLNKDEVLEYEYGDGRLSHSSSAVIVLKKPKDQDIVRPSTVEERENCAPVARRFLVAHSMNGYVIDKKYIVGAIDKKNKKIYNTKEKDNDLNSMFNEEKTDIKSDVFRK